MSWKSQSLSNIYEKFQVKLAEECFHAAIILCMDPIHERRCYTVTSSLIGCAHTQKDPCTCLWPAKNPELFQSILWCIESCAFGAQTTGITIWIEASITIEHGDRDIRTWGDSKPDCVQLSSTYSAKTSGWETGTRPLANASENLARRVENRPGRVEFCIGYIRDYPVWASAKKF